MKTLMVSLFTVVALAAAPLASARTHHHAAKPAEPHRHRWVTPLHKTAAPTRHAKAAGHHHHTAAKAKPRHHAAKPAPKPAKAHTTVKPKGHKP